MSLFRPRSLDPQPLTPSKINCRRTLILNYPSFGRVMWPAEGLLFTWWVQKKVDFATSITLFSMIHVSFFLALYPHSTWPSTGVWTAAWSSCVHWHVHHAWAWLFLAEEENEKWPRRDSNSRPCSTKLEISKFQIPVSRSVLISKSGMNPGLRSRNEKLFREQAEIWNGSKTRAKIATEFLFKNSNSSHSKPQKQDIFRYDGMFSA